MVSKKDFKKIHPVKSPVKCPKGAISPKAKLFNRGAARPQFNRVNDWLLARLSFASQNLGG